MHRVRIKSNENIVKTPRQSFVYFVNPDSDSSVFPLVPVLNEKKAQFEKFNNIPTNAYDYFQRLVELSYY